MTSYNTSTTTVTGGARLEALQIIFKDVILSTKSEKDNWEIPEIMQALSQAAGNPKAHFTMMTGERYLTYLVKVQVSQDPILIHSDGSALTNRKN